MFIARYCSDQLRIYQWTKRKNILLILHSNEYGLFIFGYTPVKIYMAQSSSSSMSIFKFFWSLIIDSSTIVFSILACKLLLFLFPFSPITELCASIFCCFISLLSMSALDSAPAPYCYREGFESLPWYVSYLSAFLVLVNPVKLGRHQCDTLVRALDYKTEWQL